MPKKQTIPLPSTAEITQAALSRLSESAEPLAAKPIATGLKFAAKISEVLITPILEELVLAGRLHSFPPATAKGKPRYWDRGLAEWGRVLIVQRIRKQGPQTAAKLKTAAKGLSEAQFKQALHSLLESGQIRQHPTIGKSKSVIYGIEPPDCEPYLRDIGTSLIKLVPQLTSAGVSFEAIAAALGAWQRKAGLPLAAPPQPPTVPNDPPADLVALIHQIEPGADRGALVTSRELRRLSQLDKSQFDELVLILARQGQLMLHRHDYAHGLSVTEREELVTDGAGNYYVGMALRRKEG